MQNFTDIPSTRTLSDSLAEILSNDKTALSLSSGTAFPTTNLQVGMPCYRSDQQKLYILTQVSPSAVWKLWMDFSGSEGKAPNAEAVDGVDSSTIVQNTRQIIAGTGLSGGGDLSVNRTLSLAAGSAAANLGYTPVNKAGDSMSGPLTISGSLSATSLFGDGSGITGISSVPAGAVSFFAMSSAPTGWLKANGAAVSRTTYADLFSAIGTIYGAGNGSTTFNLPDLRGEFLRGFDDGRGIDSGRGIGTTQAASKIWHEQFLYSYLFPVLNTNVEEIEIAGSSSYYLNINGGGGGSTRWASVRPRNIALLACIKY